MATAGAESVTDGTGSADMQSLSKNIQLVPEDVLLNLCKGPLRNFVRNCQDSQYVSRNLEIISIQQLLFHEHQLTASIIANFEKAGRMCLGVSVPDLFSSLYITQPDLCRQQCPGFIYRA